MIKLFSFLISKTIEYTTVVLTILFVIIYITYFYELIFPNLDEHNPYKTYNENNGIVFIEILSFIFSVIFLFCFYQYTFIKFVPQKNIFLYYIISAILITFLHWYKLYYGSTFYYGEVRDKQGFNFPFMAFLYVTFIIWKLNYFKNEFINLTFTITLTLLFNSLQYYFWNQVQEPWELWQS